MRPLPSRTAETPSLSDHPLSRSLLPSLSLTTPPRTPPAVLSCVASPASHNVCRRRRRCQTHIASRRPLLPPFIEYASTERHCDKTLRVLRTVDAYSSFPQFNVYIGRKRRGGPKLGRLKHFGQVKHYFYTYTFHARWQ